MKRSEPTMNDMALWAKGGYFPQIHQETLRDGRVVFVGRHPYLPGVTSQGETEAEAAEMWHEMREEVFESMEAAGVRLPEPFYYEAHVKLIPIQVRLSATVDLAPAASRSGTAKATATQAA